MRIDSENAYHQWKRLFVRMAGGHFSEDDFDDCFGEFFKNRNWPDTEPGSDDHFRDLVARSFELMLDGYGQAAGVDFLEDRPVVRQKKIRMNSVEFCMLPGAPRSLSGV